MEPILLSQEEFKRLLEGKQLRGAGLYEVGRRQIYYVDVPPSHPLYHAPYVKIWR